MTEEPNKPTDPRILYTASQLRPVGRREKLPSQSDCLGGPIDIYVLPKEHKINRPRN